MSHNSATAEHDSHGHHNISHDHDFATANQKHFDVEAGAYDAKPGAIELARRIVEGIMRKYASLFDKNSTAVLDFACGTGMFASRE